MIFTSQIIVAVASLIGVQAAPLARDHDRLSFLIKSEGAGGFLHQNGIAISMESNITKNVNFPWQDNKPHHVNYNLKCGQTVKAGINTDKDEDCPPECPFFAQNRDDSDFCTFVCVKAEECKVWNPNKPIADTIKGSKTCRGPTVNFCDVPALDGTDTCTKCIGFFKLYDEDGQCYFDHWGKIIFGTMCFCVLVAVLMVWFIDLVMRPNVNEREVEKAQLFRSRAKIHVPKADMAPGEPRHVWPMDTNLCRTDVAGPGMLLHFNFQAMLIIWPLFIAVCWTILAFCVEYDALFWLGTRRFGTPRHNCILVAYGYDTQQRLMWSKVLFLWVAYIASFIWAILLGVRQLRLFQCLDAKEKTMKDFAVQLKGLPFIPGNYASLEKDLQKAVEKATGKSLVGVCVAWDYSDYQDRIEVACARDLDERELERNVASGMGPPTPAADPTANMGFIRKWVYNREKSIFGPDEDEEEDVKELLTSLVSSNTAFAVFNTQQDRNSSLEVRVDGRNQDTAEFEFDATPYGFGKVPLTMEKVQNEPGNINWHNFNNAHRPFVCCLKGFFLVYLPALAIWFFGFYVPYAWSLYNFNYDNGAELPSYYSIVFTIIVCGGNATMYVVCDLCCDIIGFVYKYTKMITYMLMYLAACMINVFLDMVVTYWVALKVMVGLDFRTYHGERLSDVDTFTEQFETYAMQRSLGENVFAYSWPSTFFLCFVIEPFATIMIPYVIGRHIVRTHAEIRGRHAEAYLLAFEFDLGRYSDILLNVFLGILIFFFPGGYIWTLFFAMSFSHAYIYVFDHWKVCNVIPWIKITSPAVDWWAQVMMAGCCGMILSCLVFKANCESYSNYCIQDMRLIASCTAAGVAHFVVHLLLLVYLVPWLGHDSKDLETDSLFTVYESVAKEEARTWFSVNPVHCLRSKYIHKHHKHCKLAFWGKEHLLQRNPGLGCYFEDAEAETEDYSLETSLSVRSYRSTPNTSPAKRE